MNKREFLASAALGAAALPAWAQSPKTPSARGPVLLTVSGAIGAGNRGPREAVADQLMKKHGVTFTRAHGFELAELLALPAATIKPTLEYDRKRHALSGPLLTDVLRAAGASMEGNGNLSLRAIDGYAPSVSFADARKYRFMIATHMDGKPMALGGLGPLWAVFDADRFAEMAAKPVQQRFGLCPWGLYHIDVQPA